MFAHILCSMLANSKTDPQRVKENLALALTYEEAVDREYERQCEERKVRWEKQDELETQRQELRKKLEELDEKIREIKERDR